MNKISLKDIAREAGVSITTVSFVVNNKAKENRISDAVVERVRTIIANRNFKPNTVARGLRTGKTTSLGLMVEDISNYFFGNVAKTIELIAYEKGYKVFFTSTDNDDKKARDLLVTLQHQQVDGYIITPTEGLRETIAQLQKSKKPFVLFDRYFPDLETSYVILDNFSGSYQMTQHLLQKRYRNILFVTIHSQMVQMQERLEGFHKAMDEHGPGYCEQRVLHLPFTTSVGGDYRLLKAHLQDNPDIDAVFFATNYLGILGIECIANMNLDVPGDVALVSFDDHDLFRLQRPPISVVAQPIEKLANEAINMLLQLMESRTPQVIQRRIAPELILRASE